MVLIDRKDLPSAGAGEIGLIALAPAVGNAIFAATGVRVKNMPMAPESAMPDRAVAIHKLGRREGIGIPFVCALNMRRPSG